MRVKTTPLGKTTPLRVIKPPHGGFMPQKQKMTQHSNTKQNNLNQSSMKSALFETILVWPDSSISQTFMAAGGGGLRKKLLDAKIFL